MPHVTDAIRIAFCVVLLAGCATPPTSISRLDSSGLTVVTLTDAVVFARPVRTLAAGARDYAYIGPIEINRMGDRQYYFWIGLASTVDRDLVGLVPADADALVLIVDESPMVLPLVEWDTTLDNPPYVSPAPIYATLAARTSLDQIHRIANANKVELYVAVKAGSTARYQRWQGTWTTFTKLAQND